MKNRSNVHDKAADGTDWSRGKKRTWMPFEEAREIIQSEGPQTKIQYQTWHDRNWPAKIPRHPNRVYIKEWKGWGDWLGSVNKFKQPLVPKNYRPYAEAVVYVHRLKLPSCQKYFEMAKNGDLPRDLPSRPDFFYRDDWISWMQWLGNKTRAKIQVEQNVQMNAVLYVIHMKGHPGNVFKIGVAKGGKSQIEDMRKNKVFTIIKMFKMEDGFDIEKNILSYGSAYEISGYHLFPNIHEVLFNVDLDWVK